MGDKEIPKNKISKWIIKTNKNKTKKGNTDIAIGIGPKFSKVIYILNVGVLLVLEKKLDYTLKTRIKIIIIFREQ